MTLAITVALRLTGVGPRSSEVLVAQPRSGSGQCPILTGVCANGEGDDFTNAKTGHVDAILVSSDGPEAVTLVRQTKDSRFNETTEARPFHIQQA